MHGSIKVIEPIKTKINKAGTATSVNDVNVTSTPSNSHTIRCGTGELMQRYIAENQLQAVYAQEKLNKQNTPAEQDNSRTIKTIPVVFHVVYNPNIQASADANTVITAAVIDSVIARLNADFSKTTTTGVRSAFQSLISNTNIQFCLANRDPQGAVTTGITRTTTTQSYFDANSSSAISGENAMKTSTSGIVGWDHLKYVNIWLCDITDNMNICTNGCTAGYAYLGSTSQNTLPNVQNGIMIDGIVLDYNVGLFNFPQTSDLTISRSISHEMGHYLGLEHTFADNTTSCVNDDGFSDTPPVKGPFQSFYDCSSTTVQSCTPGTLWQYENIMDYSDCFVMFTPMQSNYMNNVLTNGRYGLTSWQSSACVPATPTIPVASFTGCNSNVTQNSTVNFTSTSTNFPTSWQWSITPPTGVNYVNSTSATSQNPQVSFANTGSYSVTLIATNTAGSDTLESLTCITVVAPTSNGCDTLFNITDDDTLAVYSSPGGEYLTGMNEFDDQAKAEKFLSSSYTPGYNVMGAYVYFYQFSYASAASNVKLNVWDATGSNGSPGANPLATKTVLLNTIPTSGQYPGLTYIPFTTPVAVSGDYFVGIEFTNPYVAGDTVAIVSNRNGNTPSPGTAWEKYNGAWNTMNYGWGVNLSLYIAPVMCSMTTELETGADDIDNISVYPNPSNGIVSVMVGLNKSSTVKLTVYNGMGQLVRVSEMESGNGGKADFDLSAYKNGVYFVKIETESSVVTKRVVLNK